MAHKRTHERPAGAAVRTALRMLDASVAELAHAAPGISHITDETLREDFRRRAAQVASSVRAVRSRPAATAGDLDRIARLTSVIDRLVRELDEHAA